MNEDACLWAACDRPATAGGYCDTHREMTALETQVALERTARAEALKQVGLMRQMARKVVNGERRSRWRANDQRERNRRKMAKQSKRKAR